MNRPHFLFRPNMQNEDHKRAWRLLQEVPEGQKSAFIVRAILQMDQEDRLETMLRRVLREEKLLWPDSQMPHRKPGCRMV